MADTKWLEIAVNTTPDKLDEVCAKLAAAGMDGFIPKPFDARQLYETLRSFLPPEG